MLSLTEIDVLRTMLRDTNIEYSALLKALGEARDTAKLDELRTRRSALMTQIAENGLPIGNPIV